MSGRDLPRRGWYERVYQKGEDTEGFTKKGMVPGVTKKGMVRGGLSKRERYRGVYQTGDGMGVYQKGVVWNRFCVSPICEGMKVWGV